MKDALLRWWKERVPISGDELLALTNEPVPNHMKRWWFCLGGTPAYLFIIQIVTGIMLAFYYQPSTSAAYESVAHLTNEVHYGWYFRGLHKWSATLMIAAVILHQTRVFFTGAYRAPRDLNWVVGMGLLLCTLGLGFTGYSLLYEQLSFWGATVGANICRQMPLIGDPMANMLLGGHNYSEYTLPRLYILHAAVFPAAMVGLLALHVFFIRSQGISELEFDDEPEDKPKHFDFFPDHVYTELIVGLLLMVLLSVLATVYPADQGPKANPLVTPDEIKPEWFFYASFRWLKMFSGTFAVITSGLVVFAMIIWPWIDAVLRRVTRCEYISIIIGIIVSSTIIALTVWEALPHH